MSIALQIDAEAPVPIDQDLDYQQEIARFRAAREAKLAAPDGWLSVIGLDWLEAGPNTVGSAEDNDVILSGGPPHLGVITVAADGGVDIALAGPGLATLDGQPSMGGRMVTTAEQIFNPTVVRFGAMNFHIADRDGRKGMRIKDNDAPARLNFKGLDYFAADPSWRIVADWIPLDPPRMIEVATGWGNISKRKAAFKAVFERDGKTVELFPVPNYATDLVFVMADRTSGRETYGACRFLDGEVTEDGSKIVLDFNKAINPPCAFSNFATCPIAPPENRLTLRITAGEKAFHLGY